MGELQTSERLPLYSFCFMRANVLTLPALFFFFFEEGGGLWGCHSRGPSLQHFVSDSTDCTSREPKPAIHSEWKIDTFRFYSLSWLIFHPERPGRRDAETAAIS